MESLFTMSVVIFFGGGELPFFNYVYNGYHRGKQYSTGTTIKVPHVGTRWQHIFFKVQVAIVSCHSRNTEYRIPFGCSWLQVYRPTFRVLLSSIAPILYVVFRNQKKKKELKIPRTYPFFIPIELVRKNDVSLEMHGLIKHRQNFYTIICSRWIGIFMSVRCWRKRSHHYH